MMKIIIGTFGIVCIAVLAPITVVLAVDCVKDIYRICKGGR